MTYDTRQLPAFPTDIPIADLPILRLADLLATSSGASNDELFRACRASGFFYLDLTGCELGESLLRNASNLRTIAREFMAEASREKEAYGGTTIEKPWGYRYIEDEDAIEDGEKVRKWEGLGVSTIATRDFGQLSICLQSFAPQTLRVNPLLCAILPSSLRMATLSDSLSTRAARL